MDNIQNSYIEEEWIIEVDITHRCNLKCRHCNRLCNAEPVYNTYRKVIDMDIRHIDYLCSEIRKQHPGKVKMIRILGGEPLLSPILKKSIESFEVLRSEDLVQNIVVMTNGTIPVPDYLQSYIIHYPIKIQNKIDSNGSISTKDIYAIKKEKHVNITVSPYDLGISIKSSCDRYIGCGVHYSVYGFSLCASCFPSLFVFHKNHRHFIHYLPTSIEELIGEGFAEDVCSVCVYGLRKLGIDTSKINNTKMGNRWKHEVELNNIKGFNEPSTLWIKNVM